MCQAVVNPLCSAYRREYELACAYVAENWGCPHKKYNIAAHRPLNDLTDVGKTMGL